MLLLLGERAQGLWMLHGQLAAVLEGAYVPMCGGDCGVLLSKTARRDFVQALQP
jgi:hypothetical protein